MIFRVCFPYISAADLYIQKDCTELPKICTRISFLYPPVGLKREFFKIDNKRNFLDFEPAYHRIALHSSNRTFGRFFFLLYPLVLI